MAQVSETEEGRAGKTAQRPCGGKLAEERGTERGQGRSYCEAVTINAEEGIEGDREEK